MDQGLAGTAARRFFGQVHGQEALWSAYFLQITVLKFSGMHKNFSWSVHCMVQFSIPAETIIIIGYSGMREPNPGWWQQEKTRVNSRNLSQPGGPLLREALLVFS